MIFNIPNLVTAGRILIIPILAALLHLISGSSLSVDKSLSFWAMVVFAIAGFSDLFDGYYARKYGQVSVMGKFFDPLADKLIHMTALVFLVELGRVSAWLATILLFREIFITGLRSMAAGEGIMIDAATWGKRKTLWLNFGIGALILHHPIFVGQPYELDPKLVGGFFVALGFLYSVASAVQYTFHFLRKLKG